MGYNPYICIVCGIVEDNGWGSSDIRYYKRVSIIIERIGKENCKYLESSDDENDFKENDLCLNATEDVCHKCFSKKKPDPFFQKVHTKEERRQYWINHRKKNK